MVEIPYTVWALLPVVAWLLYSQLRRWRFGAFAHIPHVFPPYLLFGNVPHIASGIKKLGDARRHPGMPACSVLDGAADVVSRLCV